MRSPKKYLTSPDVPYPHMGALLAKRIREKGFKNIDIVNKLQVNNAAITEYAKNKSLQAGILWNIGTIIGHNFFAELGTLMPVPFAHTQLENTISKLQQQLVAKDTEIKELEKELAIYKNIVLRTPQ
jgi:hypothetical protein